MAAKALGLVIPEALLARATEARVRKWHVIDGQWPHVGFRPKADMKPLSVTPPPRRSGVASGGRPWQAADPIRVSATDEGGD